MPAELLRQYEREHGNAGWGKAANGAGEDDGGAVGGGGGGDEGDKYEKSRYGQAEKTLIKFQLQVAACPTQCIR